mmetsp:Transcript_15625/g.28388  ORF Transcript_15625/g.28388 Transcript_15625/m.28388 type:complete len:106 (-) Transcript_15625:271-588(-)
MGNNACCGACKDKSDAVPLPSQGMALQLDRDEREESIVIETEQRYRNEEAPKLSTPRGVRHGVTPLGSIVWTYDDVALHKKGKELGLGLTFHGAQKNCLGFRDPS